MADYDLTELAEIYFEAYQNIDVQLMWGSALGRKSMTVVEFEREFEALDRNEQGCIKAGIKALVLRIDPDATFKF